MAATGSKLTESGWLTLNAAFSDENEIRTFQEKLVAAKKLL